jgi:BCCIP
MKYLFDKSKSDHEFRNRLADVLATTEDDGVGLVLAERIINMPPATSPHTFRMLLEEIKWAIDDVPLVMFGSQIRTNRTTFRIS